MRGFRTGKLGPVSFIYDGVGQDFALYVGRLSFSVRWAQPSEKTLEEHADEVKQALDEVLGR